MSFSDLNKEQKQLIILGIMSVIVVVALGNQLLIQPAKRAATDAQAIIDEDGRTRESGERILGRDPMLRKNLSADFTQMRKVRQEGFIPPEIGKEFWAQKRLRTLGYNLNLDLTVSEHKSASPRHIVLQGSPQNIESKIQEMSFWIPYTVEIETRLSFSQMNTLIAEIQRSEPYASVAVLRLTPSSTDKIRHNLTMVIQWPIPRNESEWRTLVETIPEASS